MTTIKTNDIKKGDRIYLSNGWWATMADNKKGTIRLAVVDGIHKEMGSIYAHDIVFRLNDDGTKDHVSLTDAQKKLIHTINFF